MILKLFYISQLFFIQKTTIYFNLIIEFYFNSNKYFFDFEICTRYPSIYTSYNFARK